MAGPPGYLRVLFEHYDNWSREVSERVSNNAQSAANGTLEPKKVITDTIYLTTTALRGLWAPLLVGVGPIPLIEIVMTANATATGSHPYPVDPSKNLDWTPLTQVAQSPQKTIAKNSIAVSAIGNTSIEVKVTTSAAQANDEIYEGRVTLDNATIAMVRVVIRPPPPP